MNLLSLYEVFEGDWNRDYIAVLSGEVDARQRSGARKGTIRRNLERPCETARGLRVGTYLGFGREQEAGTRRQQGSEEREVVFHGCPLFGKGFLECLNTIRGGGNGSGSKAAPTDESWKVRRRRVHHLATGALVEVN